MQAESRYRPAVAPHSDRHLTLRLLTPPLAFTALLLAACTTYYVPAEFGRAAGLARVGAGFGDRALARIVADMDPAMLALARRHDPLPHTDYWGRVRGWERIDISVLPSLGFGELPTFEDAQAINDAIPIADTPEAAPRFLLEARAEDRVRALHCLSQAVYYEAGFEPGQGKRAVAQVVLNRLRHAGYPKTVCGVVYQGAMRATGCQFSFTCDGSLGRPPAAAAWADAQIVARQALAGYVEPAVGTATHYHADYVSPYWAPTLVKLAKVGLHIFYRWTGPLGRPAALNGRYAGGEANLSTAILQGDDARTPTLPTGAAAAAPRIVQLDQGDGVMRSYVISDLPVAAGGALLPPGPGVGVLSPTRRRPTRAEVEAINAALAKLPEAQPRSATPPPSMAGPEPPASAAK